MWNVWFRHTEGSERMVWQCYMERSDADAGASLLAASGFHTNALGQQVGVTAVTVEECFNVNHRPE